MFAVLYLHYAFKQRSHNNLIQFFQFSSINIFYLKIFLHVNINVITGKLRHNSANDIFEGNQDMLKERGKYTTRIYYYVQSQNFRKYAHVFHEKFAVYNNRIRLT